MEKNLTTGSVFRNVILFVAISIALMALLLVLVCRISAQRSRSERCRRFGIQS